MCVCGWWIYQKNSEHYQCNTLDFDRQISASFKQGKEGKAKFFHSNCHMWRGSEVRFSFRERSVTVGSLHGSAEAIITGLDEKSSDSPSTMLCTILQDCLRVFYVLLSVRTEWSRPYIFWPQLYLLNFILI